MPNRSTIPASSASANKTTVVRGLLTELLQGKWAEPHRLTEAEACERFGVSRTPVREAFLELEGIGLLELRRHQGAIILPFGERELRDIYAVRCLLEVEACRLAATRITDEVLQPQLDAFGRIGALGDVDPDFEHDRLLHASVAEASGNLRLAAEIARYGNLVQAMRLIVAEHTRDIHKTIAVEHLAILEALRTHDPNRCVATMRQHLEQASDTASVAMARLRAGVSIA